METILSYVQNQDGGTTTFELAINIASIIGMWKMFEKAGEPGWPAIIPFYNFYKLCGITMGNPWYWLRLFVICVPVVGWVAAIYFLWQICKATALAYGKPESWAFGYLFLSPVFYCITGFDNSDYYGPMGVGDNRSSSARQAKTVSFDVVKNEPQKKTYQDHSDEVKVNANGEQTEETVDFFFDQPEE